MKALKLTPKELFRAEPVASGARGVRGQGMTIRSDAWFARQLAHALECIAEADRFHTPEQVAAAHAALAVPPSHPQQSIFDPVRQREEATHA